MGFRTIFSLTKVRLEYNQQSRYFTDDATWGFSNVEIQTDPKKCSGAIVDQFFSLVEEGSSLSEPVQGGEASKGGASPDEGASGGGGADDDDKVTEFTRTWDGISGEVKAEMRASLLLKNHTDNATEGFIGMIDDMLWKVGNGVVRDFHKSHGREETPETQAPEVLLRRIQQAAQRRKQELADAIRKHEDLQQLAVSATEKHAHAVEEAERKREVAAAVAASTKLLFKETHQAVEAPDLVGPLALIQTTATERAAVSLKVLAMDVPGQRSTPSIPAARCGTCGAARWPNGECQLWCSNSRRCSASKSGTDCRGRWNSNHEFNGHAGNDFTGTDLQQIAIGTGTPRTKDWRCGTLCKQNANCDFWVRSVEGSETGEDDAKSVWCWLKRGFTGFNSGWGWMRRGNFVVPKTNIQKTIASANKLATEAEAAASFRADNAKATAIEAKTKADTADADAKKAQGAAALAKGEAQKAKKAVADAKPGSEAYARAQVFHENKARIAAEKAEHAIRVTEEARIAGEALKAANAAHKAQVDAIAAKTEAHTALLTSMNVKIQAKAAKDAVDALKIKQQNDFDANKASRIALAVQAKAAKTEADAAKAQGLLNAEEAIKAETRAKGQRKIDAKASKDGAKREAASVRTSAYVQKKENSQTRPDEMNIQYPPCILVSLI